MNQHYFPREYTCPLCKTTFQSLTIRSSATYVERKESDFHTVYKGVSPLHYSIIVCPCCEYAASTTSFAQELSPKTAEQLALALSQLKSNNDISFGKERDSLTALRAFQLAIRTAQLKKSSSGELAGLLLASAWIAREIGEKELENRYIQEALNKYVEAFNNESKTIGNMDDLQVTYLIGELYRRTGNYKEAINWFNKVIVHQNIKQNPQIEKMTREQWALAREEVKNSIGKDLKYSENVSSPELNDSTQIKSIPVSTETPVSYIRNTVQMQANLYTDQIDWLMRVVNSGYNSSHKLVTREEVLRSLLDAVIKTLGEDIPQVFCTEEELKHKFIALLSK